MIASIYCDFAFAAKNRHIPLFLWQVSFLLACFFYFLPFFKRTKKYTLSVFSDR